LDSSTEPPNDIKDEGQHEGQYHDIITYSPDENPDPDRSDTCSPDENHDKNPCTAPYSPDENSNTILGAFVALPIGTDAENVGTDTTPHSKQTNNSQYNLCTQDPVNYVR
jgi:hypothetical protein